MSRPAVRDGPALTALLRQLSWAEWRQHPWRHAAVLLAVALGVALAFSVQLINASALSEFSSAVRAANGEVRLWVNGEEVSGGTGCEPRSGFLCLESEGAPVEFRGLRLRELP